MPWFSILPEGIQFIEFWAIRTFLFLGALAIGPWILLMLYDVVLFIFRTITYDIPYIGGRARNRPRPRAPSLSERPSGRSRTLSLPISAKPSLEQAGDTAGELKNRVAKTVDDGYKRSEEMASDRR